MKQLKKEIGKQITTGSIKLFANIYNNQELKDRAVRALLVNKQDDAAASLKALLDITTDRKTIIKHIKAAGIFVW